MRPVGLETQMLSPSFYFKGHPLMFLLKSPPPCPLLGSSLMHLFM